MTNKHVGWVLGLAALGTMLGLMAVDVHDLKTWQEVFSPSFIGNMMAHVSVVIMAFVGGKLIPTPQNQRIEDKDDV